MNDFETIEQVIAFIDERIAFYNRSLREVNHSDPTVHMDKAFYYGNMSSLLDIRDTMTKLSFNIVQPSLFNQDEYKLTGDSSQNKF